jgi:hypothetical protein
VSLVAEDGERRNFHRSVRALPAARGHAGRITCRYDIAGHSLNSRLCRVPAPPSKPTGWARVWTVLKVAGPAIVSIAAIVISILSLQGQAAANRGTQDANAAARQANAAAAAANQRRNAEQVSFLQTALPQSPFASMLVENHATTPVYEVTVQAEATVFTSLTGGPKGIKGYIAALIGGNTYLRKEFTFYLGDMPACSLGTVTNLVTAATAAMLDNTKLAAAVIGANPVAVNVMSCPSPTAAGRLGSTPISEGCRNWNTCQQIRTIQTRTWRPITRCRRVHLDYATVAVLGQ